MQNFTISKDAKIVDLSGLIQTESDQNSALNVGDKVASGTVLKLAQDSEITLVFDDGSEQRIVAVTDENLATDGQDVLTVSAQSPNQNANQTTPDDVQADINAIQDLIESGDDIELPDTAAGGLVGNEGTDFVTLNRDGNELLAGAGYDTAELDNPTAPVDDPELLARSEQPTITQSDTNTVAEDNPATGNVLDNDSDLDDVLTVQSFTVAGDTTVYLAGQTAIVEGGSLILNQDGSYTFTPAENYNGVLPVITYTTNTNASDTLTITVTPESDLTDADEVVSLAEDTSVTGNVLDNAASADGIPEVTDFTVNVTTYAVGDTAALTEGDLTVNQDGSYSFVPADNFNGTVPVVTYTVYDGTNTDISTLSINVTPESDLTDADEVVSLAEDTSVTGNVLDNAASADGTPEVTDFTVNGTTYAVGDTAALTEGDLTVNQDGSYSFVPAENFNGTVPVVTYTVSDGVNTDTSTLTIAVTPDSDLTDADESVSTAEDTNVSGNVLSNAASADGTSVIISFVIAGSTTTYAAGDTANLTEGDLTINADGSYTFAPAANYNGPVPVATYTVSDGVNTDTSTLTIAVTPESDLTDADESVSTAEDTNVSGNVLSNAASADGTPVITGFAVAGSTIAYAAGATAALAEGDLTINADGSYTFAPAANYNGPVPVATYTVSDGVNTDTSTLTIAVTPESDLTDADESVTTAEDTNVSGNVLTNAVSADGTPVITGFVIAGSTTAYAAGDTANLTEGDLTINADGSYTFVPAANYNGPVPVATYTVSDEVNTDTSTLTIAVTPESDLTDADESVSTAEDTNVSGNVLTNASSADGTPVITGFVFAGSTATYAAGDTANLTEGDLTINADGSYTFAPAANYNGPVPVATYTVSDGVNTDTSTLTIAVTPVSDLSDDNESVSTAEDTNVSGNVLSNATSADGTPVITGFAVAGSTIAYAAGATAALAEGDLTINADGSYTFAPAANYNGPVPVATYTVSDGVNTDTSTLTIAVTPVSELTDADESVSTAEDTNVSGNVLTNATSADGTPVITGFVVAGSTTTYAAGDTANLTEGDLTINADGSYTFAPAANYNGPVPVATYTVSDGVNTDTSTLTIAVTPESDLTDADESVSTAEDTNVSGNVLSNATSADGTPVITGFAVAGSTIAYAAGATAALAEGDLTINADGSYTFAPAANYNGPVPVATYTVSDGVNTDTSTLTIAVTPVSELTDADESVSTAEDTNVSGNVLTNATSADGTPVITGFVVAGSTTTYAAGDTANLTEGDLTINADGSYTFAPAANYNGPVPVATYTVSDGVNTDTSTLTIAVTPESDLTDADESVSTAEDTNVSGNVLSNAASADGTPVIISFVIAGSTTTYAAGDTANLTEGDLTINADGSYTFAPAANYNGPVPVATYTVSDGVNTDTSTLTIAVTPESDLTDADESVSTAEDTNVSGNVLSNAASADGTPVIISFVIAGSTTTYAAGDTANLTEGDLTINADGSYTFAPAANYNGPVPVATYTVSDGVNTDTSTLTIAVTPESDLTDADESVSTAEDTNVSGNVLTNATSADGTPVITGFVVAGSTTTYAAGDTANLTEGDLTINADGSYTFAPAANYNGPVPVATYTVSDGVNTDTSTLTIEVTPVNVPPVAADDNFSVSQGQSVSGNVITHDDGDGVKDSDGGDGAALTVTQVNGNDLTFVNGVATVAIKDGTLLIKEDGSFTYNNNGFVLGSAAPSFNYTLSDGSDVDTGMVTIAVVDNAPDARDDINYIALVEAYGSGKAFGRTASGNVVELGSSGDKTDISLDGFGSPILTQIQFGGSTYLFTATVTSHVISTDYGTLTINSSGKYRFETPNGMNLPSSDVNLQFTYTVQDGDNVSPEQDSAVLTINIKTPAPPPPPVQTYDLDLDINPVSETIDTALATKSLSHADESAFIYSHDLDGNDLSDILIDGNTGGLEKYLAIMGGDESPMANAELTDTDKELQVEDSVLLTKDQVDAVHTLSTTITNGLLADGGIIMSDAAANPASAPIAEIDSPEVL